MVISSSEKAAKPAPAPARASTHEVTNQPPSLEGHNLFEEDAALKEALGRDADPWATDRARAMGELCGLPETIRLGFLANENAPILHTHDRFGHRIDEVEFHPAYHELMKIAKEAGLHSLPWVETRRGAHSARAALHYLLTQVEAGVGCPITMTFACVPALRHEPEIAKEWIPRLTKLDYDARFIPADQKSSATMGMAMTEKQGGSDVRANTTRAVPIGGDGSGAEYELTGHKWFCSAPMCDAFLTLAQTEAGLSCFIVPRFLPDGARNPFLIQRLKDKLGNRSNASCEVEYLGTWARMVGEEGRGVSTIMDMVHHTRLDCTIGSAALMRQAVAQAFHHARHRKAFGKLLIDQPLMRNVLADLALESEAATQLIMRLAVAYERGGEDPAEAAFARMATAVAKFWVCKRAPHVVVEALECHGGSGYVEESILPRLYRESPLSSIWEGSGNVMCLDVLRAMGRSPDATDALLDEIAAGADAEPRLAKRLESIKADITKTEKIELHARRLVEHLAVGLQASILVRHAPPAIADAFCASRLEGDYNSIFGTLPPGVDLDPILQRQIVN